MDVAQASRLPWSGWWWPLLDSRDPNLYDDGGPLAKYDAYVEALDWGDPGTQQWELVNHSTTDPEATWWGHCHAWAAAAVLVAEPLAAGYDAGIYFSVADLKGLITELYYAPSAENYGERYNGREGEDYSDIAPGLFHQVIRYYVGQQRVALVADIDAGEQVWNYPLYAYDMGFAADDQYSNVTHVTARVSYADDGVVADYAGTQVLEKEYTYWLQFDGDEIVDSGWEGDSVEDHPDFLWVPTGRDADQTPLDMDVVQAILAPRPAQGCNEYLPNGDLASGEFAPWVALGEAQLGGDGDYYAWLAGYDEAHDVMYQTVAIPTPATAASLSYSWAMETEETEHPYDFLEVTVRDSAGKVLQTLQQIDDSAQTDTWQDSSYDLRAYAGKTIQICFEATSDDGNVTSFYVDDVHLNVCTGAVETPTSLPRPTLTPTIPAAPSGCRDAVGNGAFETGDLTDWEAGNIWTSTGYQAEVTDGVAHGGMYSVWLGGYDDADDYISQAIVIPRETSRVRLTYWWFMTTEEEEHGYDFMYARVWDADGNELQTLQTVDDGATPDTWQSASFDLASLAGQEVQIGFHATGDNSNVTSFYIDDVSLEVCGQGTPTAGVRVYLPLTRKRR